MRNDLNLNTTMYALFLGLYLMGENIPQSILEYVKYYSVKTENPNLFILFESLLGSSDLTDSTLRSMILKTLQ